MERKDAEILMMLLRSAVRGEPLSDGQKASCADTPAAVAVAQRHDVAHLLALGLKKNGLLWADSPTLEKTMLLAVYRQHKQKQALEKTCRALEAAEIPFLPLKGSVLRRYYPEEWMRTSCDIDILVKPEDLDRAIACVTALGYTEKERMTHDVSLFDSAGNHIELHFDLVEEGRANGAIRVLRSVWERATLEAGWGYRYAMPDDFFYFYHMAHMAKHFETGGCGIRPYLDLWILDRLENADPAGREQLLKQGGLWRFTQVCRQLSRAWMDGEQPEEVALQMQDFLLSGGAFGSAENRVALQQQKKGGKLGYFVSRVFVPYDRLKRYYPVLEKKPWLMPAMQVRRWFLLLDPQVKQMAREELAANKTLDRGRAGQMHRFLKDIGLE